MILFLLIFTASQPTAAKEPGSQRWEREIRAFEAADSANPPPQEAILFIGSSTIRMWKTLAQDFPQYKVLNRGFGGCQIADCTCYADRIVADGKPRVELFVKDRLHFNAEGYKILAARVRNYLTKTPAEKKAKQRVAAVTGEARTQANVMVEITFTADRDYRDAFHEVTLDALFETPQGRTLKVPAFWAGGRTWKVRYASPAVGTHRWRSVCSVPADRGLHGLTGTVTVEPYRGENPLYLHGPLRVAADRRHFEHLDGTPFFWLADTWWMGLCQRLHWPEEFQQLAADRKAKGFNVVQIVAGLYPDMPAFDRAGRTRRAFLGKRITPAFGPSTSTRPTSGCCTWSIRVSCPALSAPGDTIFPGWARSA